MRRSKRVVPYNKTKTRRSCIYIGSHVGTGLTLYRYRMLLFAHSLRLGQHPVYYITRQSQVDRVNFELCCRNDILKHLPEECCDIIKSYL